MCSQQCAIPTHPSMCCHCQTCACYCAKIVFYANFKLSFSELYSHVTITSLSQSHAGTVLDANVVAVQLNPMMNCILFIDSCGQYLCTHTGCYDAHTCVGNSKYQITVSESWSHYVTNISMPPSLSLQVPIFQCLPKFSWKTLGHRYTNHH